MNSDSEVVNLKLSLEELNYIIDSVGFSSNNSSKAKQIYNKLNRILKKHVKDTEKQKQSVDS